MHLDHAVYHEIEESREQGVNDVRLPYKLNLDGKVAALALLSLMTLPAMVLAKASFRPQNRCTGYNAARVDVYAAGDHQVERQKRKGESVVVVRTGGRDANQSDDRNGG